MGVLIVVLVLAIGVPGAIALYLALRDRRNPDPDRVLVSGMQHRIDVETRVNSMGMGSTGYRPEDPLKSEHP